MDDSDSTSQTSSPESDSESSMSSDTQEGTNTRKHRRCVKHSNYLQGKCRKVYKLNKELDQSLQESHVSMSGVCSSCASSLARIADVLNS